MQRRKSPYPATQNPSYEQSVRDRLDEIVNDSSAPIRPYITSRPSQAALDRPMGTPSLQQDRYRRSNASVALNDWLTDVPARARLTRRAAVTGGPGGRGRQCSPFSLAMRFSYIRRKSARAACDRS